MTSLEIWQALQLIRNTLIQAHVQLNDAMDQVERLAARVRLDIAADPKRDNDVA